MTTTTSTTLLDQVRAYAAEVRGHLADLAPEQVEDLTDGLEADLAEALEDSRGPVATGEIPVLAPGVPAGAPPHAGTTAADLVRRFGPAAAYAAELRAAAGLAPAPRRPRAPRVLRRPVGALRHGVDRARRSWRQGVEGLRGSRGIGPAVRLLETFAPLWWLLRAWSWWVLAVGVVSPYRFPAVARFVPAAAFWEWFWLAALAAGSVAYGRGWGTRRWWTAGLLGTAGAVAIVNLLWAVPALADEVQAVRWDGQAVVEYVEVPVYDPSGAVAQPPADGVYVDGMAVSNLFVYDSEGNPLSGVQVFDDRGRPVRTTDDGGLGLWAMPGVAEAWRFAPARDVDDRNRWNVYPLLGAPAGEWREDGALPELAPGAELRVPPPPFAKAPALAGPADGSAKGGSSDG